MLGLTFKENCQDLRNTHIVDLVRELQSYGASVNVHDSWADANEAYKSYGLTLLPSIQGNGNYAAVVLAVAHDQFKPAALTTPARSPCPTAWCTTSRVYCRKSRSTDAFKTPSLRAVGESWGGVKPHLATSSHNPLLTSPYFIGGNVC